MHRFAYPRFRQDVAFLDTPDGVYVKAPDGPFLLRGAQMYRLVSALVPQLDGLTPLTSLLADLPEHQARLVEQLVDSLGDRAVVREAGEPRPELARFDRQRMFLGDLGSTDGFDAVTRARVVVVGSDGADCDVVARGLVENGVGAVEPGAVDVLGPGEVRDDVLDAADALVVVELGHPQPGAVDLSRRAVGRCRCLSVVRLGDEIVLGPWQDAAGPAALESLLLRAAENGHAGAGLWWRVTGAGPRAAAPQPALPAVAGEIALSSVAFEVFKELGGLGRYGLHDALLRLDPTTLEMVTENAPAHPAARTGRPAPTGAAPAPVPPPEEYYAGLSRLSGRLAGVVQDFEDDAAPQLPVKVAVLAARALGSHPVVAASTDTVLAARVAAFERALGEHALHAARREALPGGSDAGHAVPDAGDLATALAPGARTGVEPVREARDLLTGETVTVPAAAVLAGPWARERTEFWPTADGVACRRTPEEAVAAGLVDALTAEVARDVEAGSTPLGEVLEEELVTAWGASADQLTTLLGNARTLGLRVRLFRVEGPVPVAAVLDDADPEPRGLLVGAVTFRAAVEEALTRLVATAQLRATPWAQACAERGPWFTTSGARCVAGTAGDGHPSATDPAAAAKAGTPGTAEPAGTDDPQRVVAPLLAALAAEGRRALAVDLTPPDLRGLTTVHRVLLTRGRR